MSTLTIRGCRKKKSFGSYTPKSRASLSFSPLWSIHCWVNHGLVEGKMQPCIKSPGLAARHICSDCLFFVQSTEALSYKEKPCKVLEWPHRKDSFRTWAFLQSVVPNDTLQKVYNEKRQQRRFQFLSNASNFQF